MAAQGRSSGHCNRMTNGMIYQFQFPRDVYTYTAQETQVVRTEQYLYAVSCNFTLASLSALFMDTIAVLFASGMARIPSEDYERDSVDNCTNLLTRAIGDIARDVDTHSRLETRL